MEHKLDSCAQPEHKLNLCTPIGQAGYGVAGFHILKELHEKGWEVSLFAKDPQSRLTDPNESKIVTETIRNSNSFPYDAPCLRIWHQHELQESVGRGKYFAFPFFELDKFTDLEKHHLEYPDYLIVASQWAKDVVCKSTDRDPDTVFIVPLGVNRSLFNPKQTLCKLDGHFDIELCSEGGKERTIFLNCGKWEVRKGHDILCDLFHTAFRSNENVELWMLPYNVFLSQEDIGNWENMYLDSPLGRAGKIKLFPWQSSHEQVASIMSAADAGIFPSRAEGWNLELLEMMAMGKPVIATNYSGHTEFCDKYNCSLIEIEETEPAYDGIWFHEQGDWACLEGNPYSQIVESMRDMHKKIQAPGVYTNDAGIETGIEFTWENSVNKLEKILLDNSQ